MELRHVTKHHYNEICDRDRDRDRDMSPLMSPQKSISLSKVTTNVTCVKSESVVFCSLENC